MTVVDAPAIIMGYKCDYEDTPCLCPFDQSNTQTFESHHLYKLHMSNIHGALPSQKRKVNAAVSDTTKEKRRLTTIRLHKEGAFLNTHIKKQVLMDFIDLYDSFLQRLFSSDEYRGAEFKTTWRNHYRITARDLEEKTLEELVEDVKEGSFSNYAMNRLRWLERELY
jgi:hypothetical protein